MDPLSIGIGVVVGALFTGLPLGWWALRDRSEPLPEPPPDPIRLPVAGFRVDGAGRITWCTETASGLFGAGLVGREFTTVLPDWGALESHRATEWVTPSGASLGPVWSLYATGVGDAPFPVRVQQMEEGETRWVVLRDMRGVHKQLERMTQVNGRLQKARDEAQHASRAKTTYLTGVAQVLRTPLNTIVGYAELLSEELEDRGLDELSSDVERILAGSTALTTILEAVLDWTEIEAGRMSVRSEVFEIGDALSDVIETMRGPLEANNAFEVDVPEGLRALADATRTAQIVGHLLSNAAKYTIGGEVKLAARRVGSCAVIVVEDSGQGMQAGELEELFVSFESRTGRRDTAGTGISLLLAHTFAKMMGGSLTVGSSKGRGTSFMLELPSVDDAIPPPPMLL